MGRIMYFIIKKTVFKFSMVKNSYLPFFDDLKIKLREVG
jgi:hypothetical protein